MENISGVLSSSSSPSSMSFVFSDDFEFEIVEGEFDSLSNWEFLDASSDSDSAMYGNEDTEQEEGGGGGAISFVKDQETEGDEVQEMFSPVISVPISLAEGEIRDRVGVYLIRNQKEDFDVEERNDYDEEEEDEISDELDDELVPWSVSNKFGRQRMRKLGKRAFPKMYNSKKSPFLFTMPGCVRGKHGMGMKHSF